MSCEVILSEARGVLSAVSSNLAEGRLALAGIPKEHAVWLSEKVLGPPGNVYGIAVNGSPLARWKYLGAEESGR